MLIVTGTLAYDYIMDFPGQFADHILPDQIHKVNLSFIVNKFAKRRGGTAGNVSYTLGLLKSPHILFSVAGNDFSEYKKTFAHMGVDISHIKIDKTQPTATGFAMTDKTNNQIWGYFYGASEKIADLTFDEIRTLGRKDLVLIGPSGAKGSMNFVNQCIKENIDYMLDPGFILTQISDNDLQLAVTNSEYIIGNDYEISLIKKRVENWQQFFKDKVIITTLGEKGAEINAKGKIYTISSVKPKKLVDPTGAGDAWRAGFLAGLEKGLDMQISGQMGSVAAAFALEEYGTQEHTFTLQEFTDRYQKTFGTS